MRIIHVENDDTVAYLVGERLGMEGHTVVHCFTLRELESRLDEETFDIAILDYKMHQSFDDVLGLVEAAGLPIILFSGMEPQDIPAHHRSQTFTHVEKVDGGGKLQLAVERLGSVIRPE